MKLELIPVGKENKKTREMLMREAGTNDIKAFQKQLAILKKEHIIIFEEGYYRPKNRKEYLDFIEKCNRNNYEYNRTIMLAYKEMKKIGG